MINGGVRQQVLAVFWNGIVIIQVQAAFEPFAPRRGREFEQRRDRSLSEAAAIARSRAGLNNTDFGNVKLSLL